MVAAGGIPRGDLPDDVGLGETGEHSGEQRAQGPGYGPTSGPDLQMMCHTMARLLMRHKDALSVLQQSTTWILFLTTQPPGIILPKLFNTAQGWHEMKYNDPESITQPMRIILWQKLMAELCLRAQKVLDDPEARDQAIQLHLYDPNAGFGYRKWSNKEGGSDEAPGGSGATPSKAHCGDSAGAGDTQRALPAPEQVSCHQATPGEDGRHDSDLALGNWLERGADCTVLGTPPASLTQLGSHDDWLHSPSRQAAEISSGTAAAIPPPIHEHAAAATAVEALAALALIPRLQLQNSSNYCYSHACLLTYLWTDSFELCRAPSASALSQVDSTDSSLASENQTALHESGASCRAPEVQLFSPTDSSPYFETECCPAGKEFCGGCAKMNTGKSACEVCSGGFTKTGSGKCVACVDLPGWVNKAGDNCLLAHCSAEKFQGFSSNSACCKCGGGQQAATKFAYFVGPIALGATQVVGHPVPRTASKYSVDKDCELAKFGLSIHPQTGALELAPGCSKVGCGSDKSIEVKCTITAEQEGGLTAQATLEVLAGDVSYGSEPVVLYSGDSTSVVPALNPEHAAGSGQFGGLACVPGDAGSWLELDAGTGKLSLKAGKQSAGGLTGGKGETMGQGSICSVEKGGAKGSVVVLSPSRWTGMRYSYGPSSDVLYATVGEKSPILQPNAEGDGLRPTRFSASCAGSAFAFDVLSGVATWDGHQIFTLDAEGGLQLSPEESLTKSLDSAQDGPVRRTVGPLQCTIFGHYEWSSARQGGVVSHRLTMEFRDHTCWAKTQQSFGSRIDKGHASESACRSKCRGELYCTHWAVDGGKCFFYSGLCKSSDVDDFACTLKHVWVTARYPGCGERHSCVDLKLPGHHYASGKYCPGGENVASASQGPVYFKKGLTTEESFWLMRHESSRTGCSSGEWAIVKPKPEQDFENDTMAYVELHGDTVACVKGSSADLPSDIFGQQEVSLTVTRLGVSGARATVAPPGCVTPNITVVDGIEEDEGSVEALVLDDPATDVANDHWLHPCSCAPPNWGSLPPVSGETVTDIPAGSNNEFMSGAAVIVDGQFACEQEYLLEVIVETESDGLDPGNCRTRCLTQECPFFWEGEVMSTKQCRIYSQCTELVREVGAIGILYGMTYRKACKVADPALCWKATKRRSFLGAGDDSYACLYQDLVEQCDHKLMLGGLGISGCGHCEYAPVKGKLLYASNGGCADYTVGGNVHVHSCHGGDNQRWYFEGELLKSDKDHMCLDYFEENVKVHECHGYNNQRWYFEPGTAFLKTRADGRCLDFHPNNGNMYVGNCPWSDTLLWNWKHNVHGGRQLASDYHHGTKCWTHDRSSNDVFVGDCTVAMKSRFYWDGERIRSEADPGLCLDASGDDRVYMYGCHSGDNQKWYFDGQLLKSRDDGRCIDFPFRVPTDNNLFRGN
eukprot:s3506_g2.t1